MPRNMKWSLYNELIDDQNKKIIYLYNSLREKFFTLDSNLKKIILDAKTNPYIIHEIHPELYNCLLSEKFIINNDYDEVSECIRIINQKFSSNAHLRITINPTLDCNLNCWYCYENHIKGSCMNMDTIKSIIKFIENKVSSDALKKLQLSFFGGEPLLKYEQVIKPIIKQCSDMCKKHDKSFMVSITTNGVCLTSTIINELKTFAKEITVQVAFDGNKSIHDSIKHFANNKGCYDIVKKQLFYAINKDLMVTIRCNYTLNNIESFKELMEDFKKYWHYANVRFSFHKVWQEKESEELFTQRAIMKEYIEKRKINSNINSYYGDSLINCYADFDNNIIINYNGDIYKCTARDFKPENRLGYISNEGNIIYNDIAIKRLNRKLTKQCFSCRLLPICTICFQQRRESANGLCPYPQTRENSSINITRYFYDALLSH